MLLKAILLGLVAMLGNENPDFDRYYWHIRKFDGDSWRIKIF